MRKIRQEEHNHPLDLPIWSTAIGRRAFLTKAGMIGLSAGLLPAFLQACAQAQVPLEATPLATGTPPQGSFFTPSPSPSPTAPSLPSPTPTATPSPAPTATATPSPTPVPSRAALSPLRIKLSHLLRRAGFGANREELDRYEKLGLEGTLRQLLDYESVEEDIDTRLSSLNLDLTRVSDLQRWWLLRMIYSKRPLLEKMTLFWHGHLTSGVSKIGKADLMYDQNIILRRYALGNYSTLLKEISRNPAMMIWLDSQVNRKSAPNENYARELMELFTTDIGHYTESDVRESARAFTGWGVKDRAFYFSPAEHDNGVKVFLGKAGNFDGNDIVDILAGQRATAEFISAKLFSFFAYPHPEPAVIASLADTYLASGYSIKAVMEKLLTSEAFYSERAYRAKIKSPVELVAGAVRNLGIQSDGQELPSLAGRMGQTLFDPPDVSGWAGGTTWINSFTLLERINFANRISNLASIPIAEKDDVAALDSFMDLLLEGSLGREERNVLTGFAKEASQFLGTSSSARPVILRSLLYLVLATPEYQLA